MKRLTLLSLGTFLTLVLVTLCACSTLGTTTTAGSATTGSTTTVSPITLTLVKAGAFAACQSLSNPADVLTKLDTAQTLLNGGSVFSALENVLLSRVTNPKDQVLLQIIIDGGALSAVLPTTNSPITLNSAAGQIVSAGFGGCRLGVGLATSAKVESLGAEVDFARAKYDAMKYLQAHPGL